MNEKIPERFDNEEINQLIEQFHKKPTREVRDRLNCILIQQRDKYVEKEQSETHRDNSLDRER